MLGIPLFLGQRRVGATALANASHGRRGRGPRCPARVAGGRRSSPRGRAWRPARARAGAGSEGVLEMARSGRGGGGGVQVARRTSRESRCRHPGPQSPSSSRRMAVAIRSCPGGARVSCCRSCETEPASRSFYLAACPFAAVARLRGWYDDGGCCPPDYERFFSGQFLARNAARSHGSGDSTRRRARWPGSGRPWESRVPCVLEIGSGIGEIEIELLKAGAERARASALALVQKRRALAEKPVGDQGGAADPRHRRRSAGSNPPTSVATQVVCYHRTTSACSARRRTAACALQLSRRTPILSVLHGVRRSAAIEAASAAAPSAR